MGGRGGNNGTTESPTTTVSCFDNRRPDSYPKNMQIAPPPRKIRSHKRAGPLTKRRREEKNCETYDQINQNIPGGECVCKLEDNSRDTVLPEEVTQSSHVGR